MLPFPTTWSDLRVALSHDWLTGMRGGERVLEILCRGFPSADIYTLINNPAAVSDDIRRHRIHTSPLQSLPGILRHYRLLLPLFPWAVGRLHPPPADLMVSTSHCVAKGVTPAPDTPHLCYCFTPMRYAWTFYREYFGTNPAKALLARPLLAWLRHWDRRTSERVDRFVAISRHVQERIRTFYGRDAAVVYPPVDTRQWTPGDGEPSEFDLIVSALVPYKRVDLAVRAYGRSGYPLRIVGVGSDYEALRRTAPPNVSLLGWQSDADILELYRSCRMLVFPGEEDFGIVPLEAQACGRPVVAYAKGGALETVVEDRSGVFFHEQTEEALLAAVDACASRRWDREAIRAHAETFDTRHFVSEFAAQIEQVLA